MGKSSRNTIAAELRKSENQGDADETSKDSVVVRQHDEVSGPDYDGLVVLNSRRPTRERSSRSKVQRSGEPNKIGEQIGEQLRSLYDDVLNQPVPDRFLELLNKLETNPISPTRSKAPGER